MIYFNVLLVYNLYLLIKCCNIAFYRSTYPCIYIRYHRYTIHVTLPCSFPLTLFGVLWFGTSFLAFSITWRWFCRTSSFLVVFEKSEVSFTPLSAVSLTTSRFCTTSFPALYPSSNCHAWTGRRRHSCDVFNFSKTPKNLPQQRV